MSATAAAPSPDWQPNLVALVCRWCSYAGADMAGTTRLQYPAAVRLVRLPCTGRMNPLFIIKAFEQGADGVLVSGCHPGDCHYVQGNFVARRRFLIFRSLMELLGLDERRLHFAWVSASEGIKWARVVKQVTEAVREAGPMGRWAGPVAREPLKSPTSSPDQPERPVPSQEELHAIEDQLREKVSALLSSGSVPLVIGYGPGSLPGQVVPTFITRPEEAASLVWSSQCHNNLAAYLPDALGRAPKVGIVTKQCDARTIVGLIQESQIKRDDVVVIAASCPGVWDGQELAARCHACTGEAPALADIELAAERAAAGVGEDPRDAELAYLESLSPNQRWAFWQVQFQRCLRCYACRAVCPLCYCETCIVEKHRPQWVPTSIDGKGNTAWNIIRAMHLSGRCGGCDGCARACPANIRLDLINRKLALEVERHFGVKAGENPEAHPVMTEFREDDPQGFFL